MLPSVGDDWLAARSWVRAQLGELLGVEPGRVDLLAEPSGRPFLGTAHGPRPPEVSVTHSASTVALALGRVRLGVDVEDLPVVPDLLGLATVVATTAELAELHGAGADLPATFQRWWTRKEAVLKAAGEGFLRDPRTCHVGAGPVAGPPPPWVVHELQGVWGDRHPVLCLATAGPATPVVRAVAGR